ncbi:uncharacterized protein LOC100596700 isoform X1 [Nomascus leucogenys]|nr:uncharacterized protein LOC100596700 isoform X1 [Nomascus leucogenys]
MCLLLILKKKFQYLLYAFFYQRNALKHQLPCQMALALRSASSSHWHPKHSSPEFSSWSSGLQSRHGGIINTLQKYYCRVRGGRCAVLSCLPKEEQIGKCSTRGRKCCRRKK